MVENACFKIGPEGLEINGPADFVKNTLEQYKSIVEKFMQFNDNTANTVTIDKPNALIEQGIETYETIEMQKVDEATKTKRNKTKSPSKSKTSSPSKVKPIPPNFGSTGLNEEKFLEFLTERTNNKSSSLDKVITIACFLTEKLNYETFQSAEITGSFDSLGVKGSNDSAQALRDLKRKKWVMGSDKEGYVLTQTAKNYVLFDLLEKK